jgi:hypothetical protein
MGIWVGDSRGGDNEFATQIVLTGLMGLVAEICRGQL